MCYPDKWNNKQWFSKKEGEKKFRELAKTYEDINTFVSLH